MSLIIFSIISFLVAFLVTYYSTPIVRYFSLKRGLLDIPNSRKVHTKPIVRLGGVSIFLGFISSSLLINFLNQNQSFFSDESYSIRLILMGNFLFFLIGLIEDLKGNIDPFKRLILQFVATSLTWFFGLKISGMSLNFFYSGSDNIIFSDFLSVVITSIFIVGTVNAINWIDGIDGLACGISLISFFSILFLLNSYYIPIVFSLIGSSLAFLKYNFKPASIIMGDSGSYLLGFSLASLTILSASESDLFNATGNINPYILVLLLLIPLFDMTRVITVRLSKGLSPFYPDKSHMHHILADLGFNYRKIITIFYSSCFISCLFAILIKNKL